MQGGLSGSCSEININVGVKIAPARRRAVEESPVLA